MPKAYAQEFRDDVVAIALQTESFVVPRLSTRCQTVGLTSQGVIFHV